MGCEHLDLEGLDRQGIADEFTEELCKYYEAKAEEVGVERMRFTERMIMLQILDQQWKDHLLSMDHLKEGIGLRGYGQKDPLVEYKKESFNIFQQMMSTFEEEALKILFHLRVSRPPEPGQSEPAEAPPVERAPARQVPASQPTNGRSAFAASRSPESATSIDAYARTARRKNRQQLAHARMAGSGDGGVVVKQVVRGKKIGRNKPCPCGSGRKYKRCHGRVG